MAFIKAILKIIRRQSGFSLTEVTIGAAILTGVALTSSKIFKNERTSQRTTELDQKVSFYHQALTKILNMAENCNSTMNRIYEVASPVSPIDFNTIYTCSSNCSDPNSGDLYYDAYIPGAYVGIPLISVNQFIDKTETWYVCKMEIVEGRITSGLVRMRIGYCMNQKIRNYKVSKDIFLNTRFSDGKFRECVDGKENAVTNLQNDLCKTLGSVTSGGTVASWDPVLTTGQIANWDPVSGKCQLTGSLTCQPGETVDGIGPDGKARCKKIVKSTDAQTLSNTLPVTCNPGQSLKTQWNNTTKKFEMKCQ